MKIEKTFRQAEERSVRRVIDTAVGIGKRRYWPWAILALLTVPAVWHAIDFENDVDPEFPKIERPTFSKMPPACYRLAEPGDTIDHLALYAAAIGMIFSLAGRFATRNDRGWFRLWDASLAISSVAFWQGCAPGPWPDGSRGLGWRNLVDPGAPASLRAALGIAGAVAAVAIARGCVETFHRRSDLLKIAKRERILGLLSVSVVLVAAGLFDIPKVEPRGYWPKWEFFWGIAAFDLVLSRLAPAWPSRRARLAAIGLGIAAFVGLHLGGREILRYQRPIDRLKVIEPGKLYISAMPSYRGLSLAHGRHRFQTIINLFPEDMPGRRSDRYEDEVRFAREHGIRYVRSPLGAATADEFLDETLRLAQDPDAWPILIHCHACMDRTPAWLGIYRFAVQGWPLAEALREIERHRGYRPKGSVTLLYNRVLPSRAPERYANDPTAKLLKRAARGTVDPFWEQYRRETARRANSPATPRVGRRDRHPESIRRP